LKAQVEEPQDSKITTLQATIDNLRRELDEADTANNKLTRDCSSSRQATTALKRLNKEQATKIGNLEKDLEVSQEALLDLETDLQKSKALRSKVEDRTE
jgi:predicted RNase H-like nuclease (RuvC/YqgF family)